KEIQVSEQLGTNDYFSQLPNRVRKQIIFPLLDASTDYVEAKKILFSVGLVSKKSYEQTKCIFFVTDVISFLSNKWSDCREKTMLSLNTVGTHHYEDLGYSLLLATMSDDTEKNIYYHCSYLLDKGADPNYQSLTFRTTPLMKAVAINNFWLVRLLVQRGALVNAQNNIGYVREHSLLYNKSRLKEKIDFLSRKLFKFSKQFTDERLVKKIYDLRASKIIRKSFKIEHFLDLAGAIVQDKNRHAPCKNFIEIDKSFPYTYWILNQITDPKNKNI